MAERAGRLGLGLIGAGRVGPAIVTALAGAGHAVVGVNALSAASRERVDAMLPGVPLLEPAELVERSELVLLAVPDEQLPDLIAGLAATSAWQPGQLVAHTSAVHGLDVLQPAVAQGVIPLAIHPILDFTGSSLDVARFDGAYMAVSAPAPVLPIAQALVVEMGAEPLVLNERDRARYAEAVATAGSFSAAIVEQATGLLADIGIAAPGRVLGPLVRSTVDNALARTAGPDPEWAELERSEFE